MKAIWNGEVLAESDDTVVVDGNHYFPSESLNKEYFRESDTNSICPWKGAASYFDLSVNGILNADAAWYYPVATKLAKQIEGKIAFWRGVEITN